MPEGKRSIHEESDDRRVATPGLTQNPGGRTRHSPSYQNEEIEHFDSPLYFSKLRKLEKPIIRKIFVQIV